MTKLWINFVGILTCWEYVNANSNDDFYTAAVVEFPLPTAPDSVVTNVESMVEETLNEYLRLINEAADSGADILAFPEGALNYIGIATRRLLIKHAVELSDGDIHNSTDFSNKCDYASKSPIISRVSLKSRENGIYVLINAIERERIARDSRAYNLYSTNIVFDRNGCIVSRYRKYNTKLDPLLNRTEIAEVQVFATDFGVIFGHFTSLDIVSKYPAYIMMQYGIQHILHPTLWYSSTPFYTSLQLHQGYSYANNIALLVAGANNLVSGQGGSGIYAGTGGALVMYQPGERMQQMLISKIPKHLDTYSIQPDNNNVVKRYNQRDMDQLFISVIPLQHTHALVNQEFKKVCEHKVCCEFYVKYSSYDAPVAPQLGYTYRLSAFSGADVHMDVEGSHEMHCALIACTEATGKCGSRFQTSTGVVRTVKFEEIRISMRVELDEQEDVDLMVMPTNVDFLLLPLPVDGFAYAASELFNENNKQYRKYTTSLLTATDTILTFGVLGRAFRLVEFHADGAFENGPFWWYLLSTMAFGATLTLVIWRIAKLKFSS